MPTTPLGALNVPNTGDLPGAWGTTAVNANMSALDGYGRGVLSLSLAAGSTFTLGAPSGSITPGTGPTQAQNAVIRLSGTLSGNNIITFPLPGYYIVENSCVGTSNYVQFRGVGTGNVVSAPTGEACHMYCDGTNVAFVNMGRVASYLDLAVSTTPLWVQQCTIPPYLACLGQTYSTVLFPALAAMLGSTFGGNGVNTFGVPDLQNRWRVPLGIGTARITLPFDGTTFGAAGGGESRAIVQANLPSLSLSVTVNDTRTFQSSNALYPSGAVLSGGGGGGGNLGIPAQQAVVPSTTVITGLAPTGGSSTPFSVINPALVAGISFIKT